MTSALLQQMALPSVARPAPPLGLEFVASRLPILPLGAQAENQRPQVCTCGSVVAGVVAFGLTWRSRAHRASERRISLRAVPRAPRGERRSPPEGGPSASSSAPPPQRRKKQANDAAANSIEFGGLQVWGPAADFIREQQRLSGGRFTPSAIQAEAMLPLFKGDSATIHAPTGTGKTLAYLLPLLMRLATTEAPRMNDSSQMRMLVLVPTADLQLQTAATARQLLGPQAATVVVVRRDLDNSKIAGSVVVATPRQVRDMLEHQDVLTSRAWQRAVVGVEIVVVDEADRLVAKWNRFQKKRRNLMGKLDACPVVLEAIAKLRKEWKGDGVPDMQLVAASATVNRNTQRKLRFSSGVDIDLIRAEGAKLPEFASNQSGQYDDGTNSWNAALTHSVRVLDQFYFPKVISAIVETVRQLECNRILVCIGKPPGRTNPGTFGLAPVTAQLRFRFEQDGIQVVRSSEAVEAAAAALSSGRITRRVKEVVVGDSEAMRGIHLDGMNAVVLVGDVDSINEYMHCAGRTCRMRPGDTTPTAGHVVSLCTDSIANRLLNWGTLTGFKVTEVPLDQHHPPVVSEELPTTSAASYAAPAAAPAADDAAGRPGSRQRRNADDDMFVEQAPDTSSDDSSLNSEGGEEVVGNFGAWS